MLNAETLQLNVKIDDANWERIPTRVRDAWLSHVTTIMEPVRPQHTSISAANADIIRFYNAVDLVLADWALRAWLAQWEAEYP